MLSQNMLRVDEKILMSVDDYNQKISFDSGYMVIFTFSPMIECLALTRFVFVIFDFQKGSKDNDSVVSNTSSRKSEISSQIHCELSAIEGEVSTNGDSCIESSKSTDTNHTQSLSDSNCKYMQSPVVNGANHFKQPNGLE